MALFLSWKAAGIADALERDLKGRIGPLLWEHYKANYGSATTAGRNLFNELAKSSKELKFSEAEDYIVALMLLHEKSLEMSDIVGRTLFLSVLANADAHLRPLLPARTLYAIDNLLQSIDSEFS